VSEKVDVPVDKHVMCVAPEAYNWMGSRFGVCLDEITFFGACARAGVGHIF